MTDSRPTITRHAERQWDARMPDTARSLAHAWGRATELEHVTEHFTDKDGNVPDSVWLYHGVAADGSEYAPLFIVNGGAIVTTYQYDGVSDHRVEAYIDAALDATVFYE